MTPELPRAPLSAPLAAMESILDASCSSFAAISCTVDFIVRDMFVPVSPSGTGKTLSESIHSRFCSSRFAPEMIISLKSAPSI